MCGPTTSPPSAGTPSRLAQAALQLPEVSTLLSSGMRHSPCNLIERLHWPEIAHLTTCALASAHVLMMRCCTSQHLLHPVREGDGNAA